ncbi:SDR family NAD(P)-dependent oxidoreductase [Actinoplanes sp. NPDC049265]|uniref:SDR family NAD(P)-dependent oxidoreductase n=1 Tax=Actinoplanes sp. NPDC049265 TaxID=3363902 RepID=UPI003712F5C9
MVTRMDKTADRFAGRTVVVTGAGSGIGRATAVRIIAEGGRVVAVDVDPTRLEELVGECGPAAVTTIDGDITDPAMAQRVVAAVDGPIHGLANVAGVMDGFVPPAEVEDASWERVFSVNVTAVMRLTRAVLPVMIAAGEGAIVNVASEAALRSSVAGAAYTASKHALVGFTGSVAFYHGPQGVRANTVAPGATRTNIAARPSSEYGSAVSRPVIAATMPAAAPPEPVAAAIAWLLSDDSLNVNGIVLPSDGGWSVR